MRTPCQRAQTSQDSGNAAVFEKTWANCAGAGPAGKGQGGKFCRGFYRGLTITVQVSRYSGTDDASVGVFLRCAFTDRMELRWRPHRPPRAAAPAALSMSASKISRAIP